MKRHIAPLFLAALLTLGGTSLFAAGPRVLPEGSLPKDVRLQPLKDLNGYFPFVVPKSKGDWESRAEEVRTRLKVALGIWPEPERTPLNPVVHGRMDMGDYTVEKAYFESVPGFYVTGNLYRPVGKPGPHPVILCPHGHWQNGRFYDAGIPAARREVAIGAERFVDEARSPLQSRCVQLARMGCIVFFYDMLGYADSQQISFDVAHKFAKQRPEMNTAKNWGLFSPQAESNLQCIMGLQTWNSIRAVDFVLTLPDVDPSRVAVTGASGGGTQTMILAGLDPRIAVSVPAVMVSTAMQGGCTCENASLLRIDTGNVEFAALFAPKPQGLLAADDWTVELETKGLPELQALYTLMGGKGRLDHRAHIHFKHNYNFVNRTAMYGWMNTNLKLGLSEPILESNYVRLTADELTVWDDKKHKQPEGGDAYERKLTAYLKQDADKQLAAAAKSPEAYRKLVVPALEVVIGRTFKTAGKVEWDMIDKMDRGSYLEMNGLLNNQTYGESVPASFLYPKEWNGKTAIWVTDSGKSGLFEEGGNGYRPIEGVQRLLDAGTTVVGLDLLYQGEFLADGKSMTEARKVANNREFAGYSHGYNHSLFARRVHDILSVLRMIQYHERRSDEVLLIGLKGAGHWVAAARALAGEEVTKAAVDTAGFRFNNVASIRHPDFQPGGAKYDDLPGMLAVGQGDLWLAGEAKVPRNFGGSVTMAKDSISAVDWLLK